jgi:hypothetical protein
MDFAEKKNSPKGGTSLLHDGWMAPLKKSTKPIPGKPVKVADPQLSEDNWQKKLEEGWNKNK